MNAARILAVAGLCSALVSTLGGFFDVPHALGVAGAIMLAGNVGALAWEDRVPGSQRAHARRSVVGTRA